MIVYDKERVAKFVGSFFQHEFWEPFTAIGWEKDGIMKGGVIYNCFEGKSIDLTFAGSLQKNFLYTVFDYPFNQLDLSRVAAKTREDNYAVISSAPKLGFKQEGILRNFYGNKSAIVYGMLRNECRYL